MLCHKFNKIIEYEPSFKLNSILNIICSREYKKKRDFKIKKWRNEIFITEIHDSMCWQGQQQEKKKWEGYRINKFIETAFMTKKRGKFQLMSKKNRYIGVVRMLSMRWSNLYGEKKESENVWQSYKLGKGLKFSNFNRPHLWITLMWFWRVRKA